MSVTTFHFESFEAFSPFSDVGPYRAADYWLLPEGTPVELLRGRLIESPKRTVHHQTVVGLLAVALLERARLSGGFCAFGPLDCGLSDDTVAQPDVLYIRRERRSILKQRVNGPPDIAIEVVDYNTARRDQVEKLDLYARYGVAEYWIVDPDSQLIEFLINENGRYVVQSPANDRYQSPRLPEVVIEIAEFWREVDRQMATD